MVRCPFSKGSMRPYLFPIVVLTSRGYFAVEVTRNFKNLMIHMFFSRETVPVRWTWGSMERLRGEKISTRLDKV